MDSVRLGRSLRTIRLRSGRRQLDVATRAGVSRALVSKVETGSIDGIDVGRLDAICRALGATLDVRVRWHGEHLDRLVDAAHASLVEACVRRLRARGWIAAVEQSFNEFGERGSVDVLAWHPEAGIVLVVEVKTLIADAQETIHRHDRKVRLAYKLAAARGWATSSVARLLVIADTTTNRRRIVSLGATFDAAYPARGDAARAWLRHPVGGLAALLFVPYATRSDLGTPPAGRTRVVVRRRQLDPVQVPPKTADGAKRVAKVTGTGG